MALKFFLTQGPIALLKIIKGFNMKKKMTETCGIILHFCKFLMSSSSEDNWILPLASPFSLLQCVVLIEVYAEIQPHTDM